MTGQHSDGGLSPAALVGLGLFVLAAVVAAGVGVVAGFGWFLTWLVGA